MSDLFSSGFDRFWSAWPIHPRKGHVRVGIDSTEKVERFAALVAAAEREACAKACEEMRPSKAEYDQRFYDGCTFSAAAIRARGQDPMPLFDDWPGGWSCPPCNQRCNQGRNCPNA